MAVTAQPDLRAELEERLAFETLLADISARFVNLPASQVDHEIEDAQRAICRQLRLDHSAVWQLEAGDPDQFLLTHLYRDPSLPKPPGRMTGSEYFPWAQGMIQARQIISVPDTSRVPAAAVRDAETWKHFSIKSVLAFPLSVGGGPAIGVLSFEATQEPRAWPEPLQKRLQLIAQVFANAIERKNADQKLRESEARLNLAAHSANAGLWTLDTASGAVWLTDKTLELLGLPPATVIDFPYFLALVHPEDRETVRRAIQRTIQDGGDASAVYRIVRPDGRLRWLSSRGRRHSRGDEEPRLLMGVTVDVTDARQAERERTELTARLLRAQEAEAARIARELHDDLGQSLALFSVNLHKTAIQLQQQAPGAETALKELRARIQQIAHQISTISHQLHSSELEFLGLAGAARQLCREVSEQHAVEVQCDCDHLPARLRSDAELCLYRVLQESLRNFVKHARAGRAEVRFQRQRGYVVLTVSDSGAGFDPQSKNARPGLGLVSMAERVRLAGGRFEVRSQPGRGATVEARLPLRNSSGAPEQDPSTPLS